MANEQEAIHEVQTKRLERWEIQTIGDITRATFGGPSAAQTTRLPTSVPAELKPTALLPRGIAEVAQGFTARLPELSGISAAQLTPYGEDATRRLAPYHWMHDVVPSPAYVSAIAVEEPPISYHVFTDHLAEPAPRTRVSSTPLRDKGYMTPTINYSLSAAAHHFRSLFTMQDVGPTRSLDENEVVLEWDQKPTLLQTMNKIWPTLKRRIALEYRKLFHIKSSVDSQPTPVGTPILTGNGESIFFEWND